MDGPFSRPRGIAAPGWKRAACKVRPVDSLHDRQRRIIQVARAGTRPSSRIRIRFSHKHTPLSLSAAGDRTASTTRERPGSGQVRSGHVTFDETGG